MTLKDSTIVAFQERFVCKIAEELNEFDNVYYEICNESNVYGDFSEEKEKEIVAWHAHFARVLHQTEKRFLKRHLIAANAHFQVKFPAKPDEPNIRHEDQYYFENPDIDIINYHYISAKTNAQGLRFNRLPSDQGRAGLIWHFLRQRDLFHKPIVFDETFSGIVRGHPERYAINRAEAWETLLSGGAGYDNLDWSFTPADETGSGMAPIGDGRRLDGRRLREWLGLLRSLLDQYDLATLIPAVGLLSETISGYGYAASTDSEGHYLLYFVDERLYRFEPCTLRALTVSLNLPPGRYSVRAFDPKTGTTTDVLVLQSEGAARLKTPEFIEDVAVLLDRAP